MRHPLSSFGNYDFQGAADFSASTIVNDNSDFGSDFEGQHQLGDYDQGLGRRFKLKKPKIKIKAPKAVSNVASVVTKPVSQAVQVVSKPVQQVTSPITKQIEQIKSVAAAVPGVSQVQQITQKGLDVASKAGIPVKAIVPTVAAAIPALAIPALALKKSEAPKVSQSYENDSYSVEQEQTISPQVLNAVSSTPVEVQNEIKKQEVTYSYSHPLLKAHQKMKGGQAGLSGFLDDLYNAQKKIVQNVIDTQKTKAIQAATTQATNLVGKQLTNLTKTNPDAQKAIAQVVSTATAAAQDTALQKAKNIFEQNKKYIYAAGGVALGLVALKLFMSRKA